MTSEVEPRSDGAKPLTETTIEEQPVPEEGVRAEVRVAMFGLMVEAKIPSAESHTTEHRQGTP